MTFSTINGWELSWGKSELLGSKESLGPIQYDLLLLGDAHELNDAC